MEITILHLLQGARNAKGLTVIIDVFRAFSTVCYACDMGIKRIITVGSIESAIHLKEINPDYILVGEINEKKPENFDFGNSPALLVMEKITGNTMVHRTSAGTQGITNAENADEIITGSFVNAGAVVRYIQKKQPEKVSLVCMGYACLYPTDEDTLCAVYIKNELEGKHNNFGEMKETIKNGSGSRFFLKENQDWSPEMDFKLCMDLNRFNFVLKVEKEVELNYLRKIES